MAGQGTYTRTEEHREALRGRSWKVSNTSNYKGNHNGREFTVGGAPWNKGKKLSSEHRAKLSGVRIGKPSWNKGERMPSKTGENNHMWKGDGVSYRALHRWVERHLGKASRCESCSASGLSGRKIHWSNISHEYKRRLDDWQRLCAKCHKAYDNNQLKVARERG